MPPPMTERHVTHHTEQATLPASSTALAAEYTSVQSLPAVLRSLVATRFASCAYDLNRQLSTSCHRCRLHKRGSYVPPVRWYADTALVIGLSKELPERLRFFVAADDRRAITEFEVRVWLAGRRR